MAKRRQAKKSTRKKLDGQNYGRDYFSNQAARMGWGTASLAESTDYEMVRLSNQYWLMLTLYRNHWIVRRIVDLPAQDMTRAWCKINCDVEPDDISRFDRVVKRTFTPHKIRQAIKWARLFGGAGCVMAIKGHENKLDQPLNIKDVGLDSYLGLIPFDRWSGMQPTSEISQNIENPLQWGLPQGYTVQDENGSKSFDVHASRVLRFCGPEVPKPELQAQMYWGISCIEPVYEDLKKRDNASWSMLQLLFRAQILAQRNTELAQILSGVGSTQAASEQWAKRMQAQNELISNQSMIILGKDGELFTTNYTFTGIGQVYEQFQMDVSGASEIPATRLFGKMPSGLGQTNDADERYYEERIAQEQDGNLRPELDKLYPVIAMSTWGKVPDDLDFTFPSIRVLTEEDKAEMTEKASAPIIAAFNAGLISQKTSLKELKQLSDTTGVFSNITDEDIENADDEPIDMSELAMGGEGGPEESPNKEEKKLAGGAEA